MRIQRAPFVALYSITFAASLVLSSQPAGADTLAYWRFEEGPDGAAVPHGDRPSGEFYPGTADTSGYGNHLSVWAEGWAGYGYRTDIAAASIPGTGAPNNFSVQNTGGFPAMFTQTGSMLQTITPAAFTIEVSFKPENGGYRTLVGRDSLGAATVNANLAALYLQIIPGNAVAIKFADVSGYWHEAISAADVVTGYNWPDASAGYWHHMAAVSDGSTLSLYLNKAAAGAGYQLVAQTDLTLSGSPNTALSAGTGDGGDWDAGNWSVGRGLYAGGHGDRAYGFIDEVRISDSALSPDRFLFIPEPTTLTLALLGGALLLLRRSRPV